MSLTEKLTAIHDEVTGLSATITAAGVTSRDGTLGDQIAQLIAGYNPGGGGGGSAESGSFSFEADTFTFTVPTSRQCNYIAIWMADKPASGEFPSSGYYNMFAFALNGYYKIECYTNNSATALAYKGGKTNSASYNYVTFNANSITGRLRASGGNQYFLANKTYNWVAW